MPGAGRDPWAGRRMVAGSLALSHARPRLAEDGRGAPAPGPQGRELKEGRPRPPLRRSEENQGEGPACGSPEAQGARGVGVMAQAPAGGALAAATMELLRRDGPTCHPRGPGVLGRPQRGGPLASLGMETGHVVRPSGLGGRSLGRPHPHCRPRRPGPWGPSVRRAQVLCFSLSPLPLPEGNWAVRGSSQGDQGRTALLLIHLCGLPFQA